MPVILLTAFARTPTIVKAIQAGAVTVIDKPYHDDDLWDAIRIALDEEAADWTSAQRQRQVRSRLENLTQEEHRVAELVVAGHSNKAIAQKTGTALRTVEKRRHNVLAKMQVSSVAELVAIFLEIRDSA